MKKHRIFNNLFQKGDPIPLLFLIGTLFAALACIVLRTLALFLAYDSAEGYFSSFSLPVSFISVLALAVLFLAFFSYEAREHFAISADYRDLPTLFASALSAVILTASAALRLTALGEGIFLATSILVILASIGAVAFFLLRIFRTSAEDDTIALFSLAPAFAALFTAINLYVSASLMINDPNKLLSIAAFSFSALFFLGEVRIALGRRKTALHTFTTLSTLLFSATTALPDLIYEGFKGTPPLGETTSAFLLLAVFLYTLARISATVVLASQREAAESALEFALGQGELATEENTGQMSLTFPEADHPEEQEEEPQISLVFPLEPEESEEFPSSDTDF